MELLTNLKGTSSRNISALHTITLSLQRDKTKFTICSTYVPVALVATVTSV